MTLTLPRYRHVQHAATALSDIARGSRPADQWLEWLFRQHKEMGKRDRASVSTLVYGVLRDVQRLRMLAGETPAAWLARHLADAGHAAADIVSLGLPPPPPDAPVSRAAQLNLPEDWLERLAAQLGEDEATRLSAALNQAAPTDLRVNTLKTSRAAARAALSAQQIQASDTPHSPLGLRLSQRLSRQSPLLLEGLLEPQDEGSQLLALFAAVRAGETVLDWCAGAGGKSLALAASMENQGRIVAGDVLASRLDKLPPRATRAGVTIIETVVHGAGTTLPSADCVLVDAPCSGTGTLRRNPELRLKHLDLPALTQLQSSILDAAATQVKPGGRLVYATCSLFAEENEAVVTDFLTRHAEFAPATPPAAFPPELIDAHGALRLWPHRHGTDGFFAAALRRKA